MGKWSRDSEELELEIARSLIVGEYGPDDTDAVDYLGRDW